MQHIDNIQKKIVTGEIISNREVAPGHFQMSLLCPHIAHNSKPGQFIQLRLNSLYDPILPRPFAVYRTKDDIFDILFNIVGKGTKLLSEKCVGDKVNIIGPLGNSFPIDNQFQHTIMVAGGIGIAPFVLLAEMAKNQQFTALIGASTQDKIVGDKDLIALGVDVRTATEDGTAGHKGMITDLLEEILEQSSDGCMILACGPIPMLKAVAKISAEYEVPAGVSLEERMACGVGACLGCVCETVSSNGEIQHKAVCSDGPIFNAREVVWK